MDLKSIALNKSLQESGILGFIFPKTFPLDDSFLYFTFIC